MTSSSHSGQGKSAEDPFLAEVEGKSLHFPSFELVAGFGYWQYDLATNTNAWSPGTYKLLGVDAQSGGAGDHRMFDGIAPEDRKRVAVTVRTAIRTRSPFSYRARFIPQNGTATMIEVHGDVLVGPSGDVVALKGVIRDIAELVHTESERDKAQHLYQLIAEQTSEIISLRDSDDKVIFCSPALSRVLGLDPSVMVEREYLNRIHPEDRPNLKRLGGPLKSGENTTNTYRIQHIQGHYMWVETVSRGVFDDAGKLIFTISVTRDVSERKLHEEKILAGQKRAEDALREVGRVKRMYEVIADSASDVIVLRSDESGILFCSPAIERLLGMRADTMDVAALYNAVHPDDRETVSRFLKPFVPGETRSAIYRLRHRLGHYVWFEDTGRAIFDEKTGKQLYMVDILRDVTERQKYEMDLRAASESAEEARRQAEAASKAKSTFLANMSHELRTPLNAIMGFSDVMRQKVFGALGDPRYTDYADQIHQSGQHLLDLITDILDAAKVESGRIELNLETVSLVEMIEACVRLVSESARLAQVSLSIDVPDPTLQIEADRRALKQILLNLLSNAIKFTKVGGRATVSAVAMTQIVELRVSDNGIGIPSMALARIGNPFEQVELDPLVKRQGTGLGLSLVRALVASHGGTMSIESEFGRGTDIILRLPHRKGGSAQLISTG